jgi:hypothetical protein
MSEDQKHDPVNHPKHYTQHPSGVECIDITEHMNFNRGNAVKYIWRAGDKGNVIQDLEKAQWYINREITRMKLEEVAKQEKEFSDSGKRMAEINAELDFDRDLNNKVTA